jgi:hypothetical protein
MPTYTIANVVVTRTANGGNPNLVEVTAELFQDGAGPIAAPAHMAMRAKCTDGGQLVRQADMRLASGPMHYLMRPASLPSNPVVVDVRLKAGRTTVAGHQGIYNP